VPEPAIVELHSTPFAYISLTSLLPQMAQTIGDGFTTLVEKFAEARAEMAGNPMAHYLDFSADSVRFELGFPVLEKDIERLRGAGLSIGRTPDGTSMKATHTGPYQSVSDTYGEMSAAMQGRGLTGTKDMWESYISPPETPPDQIRTDVIWPILNAPANLATPS
jgi:hypothetical protein